MIITIRRSFFQLNFDFSYNFLKLTLILSTGPGGQRDSEEDRLAQDAPSRLGSVDSVVSYVKVVDAKKWIIKS